MGGAGMGGMAEVTSAARASGLRAPSDAVPSPDGTTLYFTSIDTDGKGAVYKVPCAGGTPSKLETGFSSPVALAVSTDGATLYVADIGYDNGTDATADGVIYTVASAGGAKAALDSTKGYRPRALDVASDAGADAVYFSGNDKTSGAAGVFKWKGGMTTAVVMTGLSEPSGLAVATGGDIYVADVGKTWSSIKKISGGAAADWVGGLKLGYPAGVAVSADGSKVWASATDPATGHMVLLEMASSGQSMGVFDSGKDDADPAGLHRAHTVGKLTWVTASDTGGTVYEVAPAGAQLCM